MFQHFTRLSGIAMPMLLACSVILTGCSTPQGNQVASDQPAAVVPTTAPGEQPKADEEAVEHPVRAFPTETLYDLLVAELAGMDNNLPLALSNYLTQARATRDPRIVARAARVAAYAENHPALLEMSLLWSDIEPDNLDARSVATLSLGREGRLTEALKHAEFVLKQGDQEPIMGLTVSAGGSTPAQRQTLLDAYTDLRSRLPRDETVLLTYAMLLRQQGQFLTALATVDELLEQAPAKESAIMLKAQLLHQLGKKQEATKFLGTVLDGLADSKRLRLQYARFLAEDDLLGAYQQLNTLIAQYPHDAELAYTLALVCRGLNKNEEARELYTQLSKNPNMASAAHYELGQLAEEENNGDAVLLHYRAVRNGPKFLPAVVKLGRFMADNGQLSSAQLYMGQLRLEYPHYSAQLYQIESELLVENQLIGDARLILSEALDHFPNNISLLYSRSILSERENDFASSEQDLRAILAQDANNSMALNALGYTLTLHTDRYEEARQLILRALELNPGDPAIIDSLGWVLFQLGEYDTAIIHLREALEKMPDPEIAAHLGEALWANDQREEALQIWQQILEQHPDNPIILETMQRLQAE